MKTQTAIALFFGLLFMTMGNTADVQGKDHHAGNGDETRVLLRTDQGDMTIMLHNETPKHRDNFVQLAEDGFYEGLLFHRVIEGFMIQTGDPMSKDAVPGEPLGSGGPGYTIPAEFIPEFIHQKGALAAARQGDQVNPERESSGSQFYIVQGRRWSDAELDQMDARRNQPLTEAQREVYKTTGGVPHLDEAYTVFGQVVDGMELIERIAAAETDDRDRPKEDVRIIKVKIL